MKTIVSIAFSLFVAAVSFGQGLFGNDTQAFVLMPAQTIASAHTLNVHISPTGRLVLYRQLPMGTPESLFESKSDVKGKWFAYDRLTKVNKLLNIPDNVREITPMADDQSVFFETDDNESMKAFLNVNSGQVTRINTKDAEFIYLGTSSYAKCLFGISQKETLIAFYPNGSVATTKIDQRFRLSWLAGGDANNLYFLAQPADKSRKRIKATLNRASFTLTYSEFTENELEALISRQDQQGPDFLSIPSGDTDYISLYEESTVLAASPNQSGTAAKNTKLVKKETVQSLIPKSTRLGPTGGEVEFSPQRDFVVYQDAGALLLREIKPIDKLLAEKLATDEIKKKLLSKAKQVGTAFAIYASDYDDVVPGQEGWENKLMPYTKNRELLNDFNYSFRGGDMNLITDPANTELGFVLGPGGRAVVYIDGHAEWISNP